MCVHFLTINPTVHLAQYGTPVMLTMQLEETQYPLFLNNAITISRGNYEEKSMISCHAISNSTSTQGIVPPGKCFKHVFSLILFK